MKRIRIMLGAALAAMMVSCVQVPVSKGVQHVVVVWLKKPGDAADRERVVAASREFRSIPGVCDLTVGTCVPGGRPIIDGTYDVAISMRFADEAAMQAYVEHPDHKAAAEAIIKPLAKKVLVYDFRLR